MLDHTKIRANSSFHFKKDVGKFEHSMLARVVHARREAKVARVNAYSAVVRNSMN